jgi:polysaccharide deacetylase family protein (PEP-CTERM system associated)
MTPKSALKAGLLAVDCKRVGLLIARVISAGRLLVWEDGVETRDSGAIEHAPHTPPAILTVDVEDYFQVEAFADRVSPSSWPEFPSRVRQNTIRVLQILEQYGCRGTFFVLGWVAERDPKLVREIAAAGHEVACHSYLHRRVCSLTPEEFRKDLRRARAAIENAAGTPVVGHRAPTFSIGRHDSWALEILSDEGFVYDSSIFPIRHDLYGFAGSPRFPYVVNLKSKRRLFEIPMSTVRIAGMTLPVGGGGYLRLLPMAYTRWAARRVRGKERQPLIVYFHPWELDPDQPPIAGRWKSRLRHYAGLRSMERRVRELLSGGDFTPMIDLVHKLAPSIELGADSPARLRPDPGVLSGS